MAQVLAAVIVAAMGFSAGFVAGVGYLLKKIEEDETNG